MDFVDFVEIFYHHLQYHHLPFSVYIVFFTGLSRNTNVFVSKWSPRSLCGILFPIWKPLRIFYVNCWNDWFDHNSSILFSEPQATSKKRRERGSFFSTIFCCFGGQQSAKATFQPNSGETRPPNLNNTASVIHQAAPNNNQNALPQCYHEDEREEEANVTPEVILFSYLF